VKEKCGLHAAFDSTPQNPLYTQKNLQIFLTEAQLYIAHFVPNFVAMAVGVSW